MNIDKIIFKVDNLEYIAVKCYGYKILNKTFFTFIEPRRYKRYFPYWKIIQNNNIKRVNDNFEYRKMFDLLIRYSDYECFNHKEEKINKDFKLYKYIYQKDLMLNKGIKDLTLAKQLVNELSMEKLLK